MSARSRLSTRAPAAQLRLKAAEAVRKVEPGTDGNPVDIDIDIKWWPDD